MEELGALARALWREDEGLLSRGGFTAMTFAVAAQDNALVLGTDWLKGSEREPLTPVESGLARSHGPPERMRFDTVLDGAYQRAFYSGTPYYRTFTGV